MKSKTPPVTPMKCTALSSTSPFSSLLLSSCWPSFKVWLPVLLCVSVGLNKHDSYYLSASVTMFYSKRFVHSCIC